MASTLRIRAQIAPDHHQQRHVKFVPVAAAQQRRQLLMTFPAIATAMIFNINRPAIAEEAIAVVEEIAPSSLDDGSPLPAAEAAAEDVDAQLQPSSTATAAEPNDYIKGLLAKSESNREQRDKALREKYCYRQAELGIGDCAGLRLIPGATKSGVQKRPEWLDKLIFGDNPPPS